MYTKRTKIVASILVFILMMTNVSMLGEAFASNLGNQALQSTNNKNVEFDAYFMSENKKEHTATKAIGEENYLYTAIQVKETGYLKNAVVTLENANFTMKNVDNKQIEKVEGNKICFGQIKYGNVVEVALPIEILQSENIIAEQLNKNNTIKFTATYVDGKGKENKIEKDIDLQLTWNTEKEAQFNMQVSKFIPYNINENKGLLLQTTVQSSLKDNILPVKENQIEITVPTINNYKPEQIKVVANSTKATNGDETGIHFTQENYTYNKEENKLIINVKNELNGKNQISWKKQVQDEFVITYLYSEETLNNLVEEGNKVSIKAVNTLTTYEEQEATVTKTYEGEIILKEQIGNLVDFQLKTDIEELSKGQIYANYEATNKVETQYQETISANIGLAELTDKIVLNLEKDNFITNKNKKAEATENNYKTISIEKEQFDKMLGQEGAITFYVGNTKIAQIDAQTEVDKQGNLNVDITENNVNSLRIETTKPQTEGTINFTITKAIKTENSYTQAQMQNMNKLVLNVVGNAQNAQTNFAEQTINKEITLIEPTLQAELNIDSNQLSTVVTNQNVKITAVLKTDNLNCMLYKNPTLRITLPNYIEQINVKNIEVLFNEEGSKLIAKSHEVVQNADGSKTIVIILEGNQTAYTLASVSKGVNVVITTDITVNKLTPNKQEKVTMQITNNSNTRSASQTSEVSAEIKFVAPTGVVTTSSVSGYKDGAEELTSISGEEKTAIVETIAAARNTNFSMNVINNYNNTIENISILGRTNFKGNTDIVTGKDLGSTISMPLTSNISVNNIEASKVEVYYSANANATKNLNETSNGWTTSPENLAEVKSYLIVLKDTTLNTAEAINFNYTAEIPANLQHNEASYETYAVYFNNNLETGTIEEKAIATKVGIATSEGPVLETKLTSNVKEEVEVPTGKFIKYTLEVKNTGEQVAENVEASIELPNCVSYIEFEGKEGEDYYTQDSTRKTLTYNFESIAVNETKTQSFWVIVNNLTVEDICKEESHYEEYEGNLYHNSEKYPHEDSEYKTDIGIKAVITAKDLEKEIKTEEAKNTLTKAYFAIESYATNNGASEILSEGETLTYGYRVKLYDYDRTAKNTTITMVIPDGLSYEDAYLSTYDVEKDEVTYHRENIEYDQKTKTVTINIGETKNFANGTIEIITKVEKLPEGTYQKQIEATIKVKADDIAEETSNKITTMVGKENITITQTSTISNNATISAGEDYSYKFEVKNTGGREADNITFKMKVPEALQYVLTTIEIGDYTNSYYSITEENILEASFALKEGEIAKITVEVIANQLDDDQTISNFATVSSEYIGTISSNTMKHTIEKFVQKNVDNPNTPEETTKRITGQIWKDKNHDGIKDIEEETVENVQVLLFNNDTGKMVTDEQGNRVTQVTNADGTYEFTGIKQATYTVIFLYDVANYSATTYHAEKVDETKNSDGVDTEITLDGEKTVAAITEQITISEKNCYNIDLGLVENPKFDLRLEKMVSKITVQDSTGTTIYDYKDTKLAKRDLVAKRINETTILVEYKIKVTNEGAISGYVKKIADYIPTEMKFSSELNKDWYADQNGTIYNASLANTLINPGESKEVTLLLTKKLTEDNLNIYSNTAEIYEAYNDLGIQDVDSTAGNKLSNEDDISSADVLVSVKTGEAILFVGLSISIITIIGAGAYFIKKKVLR